MALASIISKGLIHFSDESWCWISMGAGIAILGGLLFRLWEHLFADKEEK
jgi:hypothetical protein